MVESARRTVLVVDDDPAIRAWLTRSLEALGYLVISADNRSRAASILNGYHVDAMILDLRLGEASGLEVLDLVRGSDRLAPLPVIMFTGIAQMTDEEEASIRRNGAYVFYKPAAITEIAATLNREFQRKAS